jgi:hypothetical protein
MGVEGRLKSLAMVGSWNSIVAGNGCNSLYKEWHSLEGQIILMVRQKRTKFSFCCFGGVRGVKLSVVKVKCVVLCVVGDECPIVGLSFSFLEQVILLCYKFYGRRCKFTIMIYESIQGKWWQSLEVSWAL